MGNHLSGGINPQPTMLPPPPQEYMQDAARRVQARFDAVLGLPQPLADELGYFGPEVLPFTPWHHFMLMGLENALVGTGKLLDFAECLGALWVMSPQFRQCSAWNKAWFKFRWTSARFARQAPRIARALQIHVAAGLIDRPPALVSKTVTPRAGLADQPLDLVALEMVCRRELGYRGREFWDTPYAHTMQLLTLLNSAKNPEGVKFDETSRQIREILKKRREHAAQASMSTPGVN